ncbi:hypothetical protein PHISCL_07653 [Aspergillus sclerotialis]|uniref:Uncharacterized protein n=1 Tax=Aspergillus sclerotialis TaxID=2070753 RepID=A0A3A2ZAR8_9EURO|nr:hypothetical protein PHISCL_07653 [Aspergillus sclerotialis]
MTPAFNSAAPYSISGTSTLEGMHSAGFVNTYAFFFLSMAMLMLVYMICATRTNVVYVTIFFSLVVFFCLAAAAYWRMGVGDKITGERLVVGSGATLFVTSLCGWWVFTAQLLDSVGFPIALPIGDLSHLWDLQRNKGNFAQDVESSNVSDN